MDSMLEGGVVESEEVESGEEGGGGRERATKEGP